MTQAFVKQAFRIASATAYAPGTIGNIGPGLDILGLAVEGIGDTVRADVVDAPGLAITDAGHADLPTDPGCHTAGIAAREVLRRAGMPVYGIALSVTKGLPLSGGQGGSAASAVAGAVAVNALLKHPLQVPELLAACLVAESTVAGRHLDNIGPSLLGGCVIVRSVDDGDVYRIPTPAELCIVLVHPHQHMPTAQGRAVLPSSIAREVFVVQAAHIAALVAAFTLNDYDLLRRSIHDIVAEPARAPLLHGFRDAQEAALQAGALGCSISGSGPTAFAFARGDAHAARIAEAMRVAYANAGVGSDVLVTRVDTVGARVLG